MPRLPTRPYLPLLASAGPVRRALTPALWSSALSGVSTSTQIALTYDDGPDPASTPAFLDLLAKYDVRATFFVLAGHADDGVLLREMISAGHELGIHGWDHTAVLLRGPRRLREELRRARDVVEAHTQVAVQWYRPPYGLLTRSAFSVARSVGLEVVLWSAWGRDWTGGATPRSIERLVLRQIRPGGTLLLHDTDRTSAPGSWRATLAASRSLLELWDRRQQAVGTLSDHWCGNVPTRQDGLRPVGDAANHLTAQTDTLGPGPSGN